MNKVSQEIGRKSEECAKIYLKQQGLTWILSNYRCPQGEIDLIMRDQDTVVFVEVRYRQQPDFGENFETITGIKQQRLIKAAWHYLLEIEGVEKVYGRFDIVGVAPDKEIYWIQNAFEVKY